MILKKRTPEEIVNYYTKIILEDYLKKTEVKDVLNKYLINKPLILEHIKEELDL